MRRLRNGLEGEVVARRQAAAENEATVAKLALVALTPRIPWEQDKPLSFWRQPVRRSCRRPHWIAGEPFAARTGGDVTNATNQL